MTLKVGTYIYDAWIYSRSIYAVVIAVQGGLLPGWEVVALDDIDLSDMRDRFPNHGTPQPSAKALLSRRAAEQVHEEMLKKKDDDYDDNCRQMVKQRAIERVQREQLGKRREFAKCRQLRCCFEEGM